MQLWSSAFREGERIPNKYTCDGENVNPPLAWDDVPAETKSFILIADDHDTPLNSSSWVLINIDAAVREIPENFLIERDKPNPNAVSRGPYFGPCPAGGPHQYFFKLFALDVPSIQLKDILIETIIAKHTIATAILSGRYERPFGRMKLWSKSFKDGDTIPARYTCEGENISPHLTWYNVPEGTKSFALVMEDPDAPAPPFVHWVVIDINSRTREIPENDVPPGAIVLENSTEKRTYFGPCPYSTDHHYTFRLFALNVSTLSIDKENLFEYIERAKIAEAVMIGRYMKHIPKRVLKHELVAPVT